MRKTVAFGFVGTVLDYAGRGSQRWEKWRPTLCLCQQEMLVVHRLELLYDARSRSLFEGLKKDIASVSPETEVVRRRRNRDPQPVGLRRGLRLPARFRPQPYLSSRR